MQIGRDTLTRSFFLAVLFLLIPVRFAHAEEIERGQSIAEVGMHRQLLDLDVDGALPLNRAGGPYGRLRIGKLWINGDSFQSLGAAFRFGTPYDWGFLVEGERLNLALGLWTQVSAGVSKNLHPLAAAAVGWSLFGLDLSTEIAHPKPAWFLVAKVRIPLSIIFLKI